MQTEKREKRFYFPGEIYNEYGGPFCDKIKLNQHVLGDLAGLLGSPQTSFIIKNDDTVKAGEIIPIMKSGKDGVSQFDYFFEEHKPIFTFSYDPDAKKSFFVFNSNVIDADIQTKQRELDFDQKEYQKIFLDLLKRAITKGIMDWASCEIDNLTSRDLPLIKLAKRIKVGRFLKKHKEMLVQISQ